MIVDAPGGDEQRVAHASGQRVEQRVDVAAGGRRVGHVHQRIHALAGQRLAQRGVIEAIGHDRAHAGGQPAGIAPPVEHDDLVAVAPQRLQQVQADELGAAGDEDAHC